MEPRDKLATVLMRGEALNPALRLRPAAHLFSERCKRVEALEASNGGKPRGTPTSVAFLELEASTKKRAEEKALADAARFEKVVTQMKETGDLVPNWPSVVNE